MSLANASGILTVYNVILCGRRGTWGDPGVNLLQVANRVLHSVPIAETAARFVLEGCEAVIFCVRSEYVCGVDVQVVGCKCGLYCA